MNKQELIDKRALIEKLMEMPGVGSNSDALETIKRFPVHEQRKPVVPQFVADWFEDNKDDLEFAIWKLTIDSNSDYTKNKNEMRHWIQYAPNKPYKTLIGMLNGYEVEKEPLWAIKNADGNYLTKCALWGKDGVNYSFECNPSYRLLFTDKATADAAALLVNGIVEEEAEG